MPSLRFGAVLAVLVAAAIGGAVVAETVLGVSPVVGLYGGVGAAMPVVLVYAVMASQGEGGAPS